MTRLLQLSVFAVLIVVAMTVTPATAKGPFTTAENDAYRVVFSGGTPVLQYRYDGVPYKPYIKELFTPGGIQVLRDAPADHLHHHGIMFAVAAGGTTFWVEAPESGRQVARELTAPKITVGRGCSRIAFVQELDWVLPGAEEATLEEQRTIEVIEAEDVKPTLVTWATQLAVGGDQQSVEITGDHYYGLGCRLLQSLDRVGRFVYSSGEPGPIVRGEERVTRSDWCAYVAPAEDAQMTIAVFDHPNNLRHPATMFTMPEHFAYLSATLNVWKEPLTIEASQPLRLVYGVAVWDGEAKADEIDATYHQWALLCDAPQTPEP